MVECTYSGQITLSPRTSCSSMGIVGLLAAPQPCVAYRMGRGVIPRQVKGRRVDEQHNIVWRSLYEDMYKKSRINLAKVRAAYTPFPCDLNQQGPIHTRRFVGRAGAISGYRF